MQCKCISGSLSGPAPLASREIKWSRKRESLGTRLYLLILVFMKNWKAGRVRESGTRKILPRVSIWSEWYYGQHQEACRRLSIDPWRHWKAQERSVCSKYSACRIILALQVFVGVPDTRLLKDVLLMIWCVNQLTKQWRLVLRCWHVVFYCNYGATI